MAYNIGNITGIQASNFEDALREYNRRTGSNLPTSRAPAQVRGRTGSTIFQGEDIGGYGSEGAVLDPQPRYVPPVSQFAGNQQGPMGANVQDVGSNQANTFAGAAAQAQGINSMITNMPAGQFNQYTLSQLQNLIDTSPELANNPRIRARMGELSQPTVRKPDHIA
tara:strand:- start:33 stop:530 length:498 start_codon:yes stop_codon:yes gene_type:complete